MKLENVLYLENEDVDENGRLSEFIITLSEGKPILVMCQGSFCGHCQTAKPEFQLSATKNGDIVHATILLDGNESEQELSNRMDKYIKDFQGVPHYALFKNGKFYKTHDGPRTEKALIEFARS